MSEVTYEGKIYKDLDMDVQKSFEAVNIHTFRYFPKDRLWMASDLTTKYFHINKFYKINDYDNGPGVIYEGDRDKDHALYTAIVSGERDVVSDHLRSSDGEKNFRVTLAAIERDENGKPVTVSGIIEDYDEKMVEGELIRMLANDYYSVFCVDF